jgi:hypothetical protein
MPDAAAPALNRSTKFACLAVAESRTTISALLDLGDGFAISGALPTDALKTWHDGIGSFHRDELAAARLFLWALRSSKTPENLDDENRALGVRAYRLYLGILLGVPYFANGRLTAMTGANADGTARVRSLTWYHRTYYAVGSPIAPLTLARARDSATIAKALQRHSSDPRHRMVRALRAFRLGAESHELGDRLHQFVRTIEAFVVPPPKGSAVHFGRRLGPLLKPRGYAVAKELYDIRSAVEHLRGPFGGLPRKPRGGKRLRLLIRAIEAEAIARYLLFTYFTNRSLWPHFGDKRAAEAQWETGAPALLAAAGDPIPLLRLRRSLDPKAIRRYLLREKE